MITTWMKQQVLHFYLRDGKNLNRTIKMLARTPKMLTGQQKFKQDGVSTQRGECT